MDKEIKINRRSAIINLVILGGLANLIARIS